MITGRRPTMQIRQPNGIRHHRRGAVAVMVVVVILIISGMVAQLARRAVLDRRQVTQDLRHRQTWELMTAGIRRAQRQRQLDVGWQGETWKPVVGADSQTNASEVVITTSGRTITVVARFPVDGPLPVQITHQVELETP